MKAQSLTQLHYAAYGGCNWYRTSIFRFSAERIDHLCYTPIFVLRERIELSSTGRKPVVLAVRRTEQINQDVNELYTLPSFVRLVGFEPTPLAFQTSASTKLA